MKKTAETEGLAPDDNGQVADAEVAGGAEEDRGLVLAEKLDFTHFLRAADAGEEQPAEERDTAAVTGRVAGERTGEAVKGQLDENGAADADAFDDKAHEEVLDIVGRGISALDAIASAVPLNEKGVLSPASIVQLYAALRDFDPPTMSAIAMAGLQRTYSLHIMEQQVAGMRKAYADVNNQLEEERQNGAVMCAESAEAQEQLQAQLREAQEAVAEYGKQLEDAEDQRETAEKERDAILTDYHALQEELEKLRRSSEASTPAARRRTLFDKLPEDVPDVFGMRRMSTMLKQQADGKHTLMDGGELLTTFLTEMKESLPSNKGIIVDKITELGQYIAKGDEEFAELARASGIIVGSRGVLDAVLLPADLKKAITAVQTAIKQDSYKTRKDWNDMRDVNRKLADLFNQPTHKRTVLCEALRSEEPKLVMEHWNARYSEAIKQLPADQRRMERAKNIELVRQQDQELLAVALEALLAEHNVQFSDTCKSKRGAVHIDDITSKGFVLMLAAVSNFDTEHVEKHVKALFDIMSFPDSFKGRFHGNLATFNAVLDTELDLFEQHTGVINRHLIHQLLVMDVMLTSDVKTISSWRKQVKDHDKFVAELQSLKLMQENFTTVFKHACEYQRNYATDADGWHKKPLTLLEYEKLYPKRSERAHFVRGDSAPVCGLCGKQHAQGACLLDVNFKRVVDESSVVLRGVSDLMTLGQKLLTEVSKNKDAGANTSKLTAFVEKSDEIVTRFRTAMAFQRKRFSKVQNLPKQTKALVAQEDEDATAQVAGTTTIRETVQKAMEAYALKPQELAKQIAGAMMRADKPSRTCYRWLNKGQCDNKDKGECKFDHPDELKGTGMQAKTTAAAASGQTTKGSAAADGQVPGTLCAQCKTYPCCREDGRQHKYCSKTCAKAAGAYPGKAAAAKQATHVGMHGAAQAEDVPDPAAALMIAAGVMPMESFDHIPMSFNAMCFAILSDNGAIVKSNADHNLVSLSQPEAGQNTTPSSSLQAAQIKHIGPGLLSALGGAIPTIDLKPLLVNDSNSTLPSRLNLTGFNSFEILRTEADCGSAIQAVVAKINYRIWAEEHKWKFWKKRTVFMAWKHEGQEARASLDRDYWKLRKLKWRARKAKKPGKSEVDVDEFGSTRSMSEMRAEIGACKGAQKSLPWKIRDWRIQPATIVESIRRGEETEYPHLAQEGKQGARTRAALRVAQTGGHGEGIKLSVQWTTFMKARRRRAIGRLHQRREKLLVILRQKEHLKLMKERQCEAEMELSNSAWSRLSNDEDIGFHWYDDDEIWAAGFWDAYEVRELERAQQEHLDRLTALLGDAEAAAEAAAVPDDVWEQLQLDTVGPVRWKQAVGNMSLQTAYNESRDKAQAVMPREDQRPAQTELDARCFREWWPLSTASKVRGLNLYEVVQAERCHGQMDSNPACEILQKVLKCFKINRPAGIALSLVDSGSTCFLTPLDEHLIVRYACATPITGIGNSTAKNYSPMIMGAVTSTGQYHVMHYPRIYEMKSLDFTIVSTPALERCGYEFRLNANSSRMITPGGEVVPLVRDPGTGFHFLVDHLQAKPVLERKRLLLAEFAREKGQVLDDRFKLEDAEASPSGPDTAEGINELLSTNFGTEFAWATQGVARNGALANLPSGTVVWAHLSKNKWWPARIQDPKDAPEFIRSVMKADTILVHFFDNWEKAVKDPTIRSYRWMKAASLRNFQEDFSSKSAAMKTPMFKQHVRIALSYCKGFSPDAWEALSMESSAAVGPSCNDSSRVGGATPVVPAVDIDLPGPRTPAVPVVDRKGPQVDADRCTPVVFDTPPEGLESATVTGEGPDLGTHTTDEHYFREQQGYSEKHARKPIRLRLPAIRLVDTGVPEEMAKLQKYLHELLGHFGWALIKEALPFLVDEDVVKYLRKVSAQPSGACAGCIEGKSKSEPLPQGKTSRPKAILRDEKVYLDLSGRIEEPSAGHNYHYYMSAIKSSGFAVVTGLTFKSQALLGAAKIFSKLGGAPKRLQIDGEGNLNTSLALNYFEGARECEVITTAAGSHFRNGKVERLHQTLKGCVRAMLLQSGLSVRFWYHALQHAVLIYNLLSVARDENDEKLNCTVWEYHYGTKPVLQNLLLGPFGCLAYLILSEEKRRARGLSGHFGIRALAGVYLGCVFNPNTGVFDHLITDGRSIFSSPNQVKCIPDVYPMKFSSSRAQSLIPHHAEDFMLSHEGEGISHAQIFEKCWVAARKAKVTQTQAENEAKPKGMKTKLKGDERVYGKNKKKPLKIVSEVEGGEAVVSEALAQVDEIDDDINLEDQRDYMVEPLRDEFCFEEPYEGAKYNLVVPVGFSDQKLVPSETEHPHKRFVGRKIRKMFEVDDITKKLVAKSFAGVVLSYSPERQLFKVMYDDDNDKEDLDFYELTQVLVMGKKWGDPPECEGYTRAERIQILKQQVLMREVKEEINCVLESRIDRAYEAWYASEKEQMFRAVDDVIGDGTLEVPVPDMSRETIYDDEPKTEKEVEAHKECAEIRKAAWKEIQQLIEMSVGVLLDERQAQAIEKDKKVQVLRSKMVYKRKYEISPTDGKEYFLKWKSRLAAVGCTQEPGVDTVWNTFSPTIGFTAIRTLIATMCNPKWYVDSYDLSGAFLGTRLEDQAVYMRLPPGAGEYSNKILRLTRSIYGLRGASKAFMKQLGSEVESFSEKVEYKDADGKMKVECARFERLVTDQCMFRYKDARGREMIFASYVDDIICCTTDLELRERFFEHLRKTWSITHEGTLDRFLGIHFERGKDKWSWSATMGTYIDKIVKRFGLEESRGVKTPMEPGFVLTEEDFAEEPTESMISEMRSLIGSIGYCATAVRFDISHAVSVLSRHLARPCVKVIEAAKRIIKYLAGTRDFAVKWTSSALEEEQGSANVIIGAVDASFAMDAMTRKSHGGFINFVNNGAVSWKSGLQSIVTLSSCEAEYVALCSEVSEVKYLRSLMRELGLKQAESTLIWEDNKAAILIAENECSSAGRSKHIDVRYKFVAQAITEGSVRVRYTPTDMNLADVLTKAVPLATFERLVRLCLESKRGEYYVKLADEKMSYVSDEKTWMVTDMW